MPPRNFKSLSLPDLTYEGVQRARAAVLHRGLTAIPPEYLSPPACPCCRGAVDRITVGVPHIRCHTCGYTQQTIIATGAGANTAFTTGALVGAALAALFAAMSNDQRAAS